VTLVLLAMAVATASLAAGKSAPKQRVTLPDVVGEVPATWKAVPPPGMSAQFRLAQYRLPRAGGATSDAELIVFYFGPGGGGGVPENIERWKGMFENPSGGKTTTASRAGLRITTVEFSGTYKERSSPMAPTFTPRPGYRMYAAAVETTGEGGQGPYWIRLVGPAKSITAAKPAWDAFLASLRVKK
jgi:hypothetical protein